MGGVNAIAGRKANKAGAVTTIDIARIVPSVFFKLNTYLKFHFTGAGTDYNVPVNAVTGERSTL
jgi:hypothetical protein